MQDTENNDNDQNNFEQTKPLTPDEQQMLVNKSEQVLANFRKLDSEIKFSSREFENKFDSINGELKKWSEILVDFKAAMDEKLLVLTRETTILTALPDKLENRLKQLIPSIASEIQKQAFQKFEAAIDQASKSVDEVNNRVQAANNLLLENSQKAFRKKLLFLAVLLSTTIICSTAITYGIMQLFPKTVKIDTTGSINIDNGNIHIWGTGNSTLQQGRKK